MSQPAPCTDDAPLSTQQFGDALRADLTRVRERGQRVARLWVMRVSQRDLYLLRLHVLLAYPTEAWAYEVRVSDDTVHPEARVMRLAYMIVSRMHMGGPGWDRASKRRRPSMHGGTSGK